MFNSNNKAKNTGSLTRPLREPFSRIRMALPFLINSDRASTIFPVPKSETLLGKVIDVNSNETACLSDGNLAITPLIDFDLEAKNEQEIDDLEVQISSETSDFEVSLKCNPLDGFLYLKVPANEAIRISSSEKIFVSEVYNNKIEEGEEQTSLKIVVIYVDALSAPNFIDSSFLSLYMPNTHAYFNTALKFENHFASAEWTTPGFTSLITGKNSHEHDRVYSSDQVRTLSTQLAPIENSVVSDLLGKKFFTGYFGGISHLNPALGYAKDFCRYLYMPDANASELISLFIEQDTSTKLLRSFNWISFMDAHQVQHLSPKSRRNINSLLRNFDFPFQEQSMKMTGLTKEQLFDYSLRLFDLDAQLATLYNYLSRFNDQDLMTVLVSDHGGAPLRNRQSECLDNERTKIPLYIKSSKIKDRNIYTYTSNKDFRNIVNLMTDNVQIDPNQFSDSILEDNFIMTESRYIGKEYLCRIIDRLSGGDIHFRGGTVMADGIVDLQELKLTSMRDSIDLHNVVDWANKKFFESEKFLNEINLKLLS
jgi:hypothetical protein